MQKSRLSALAIILVLLVILFALITQRMILSRKDDNPGFEADRFYGRIKNLTSLLNTAKIQGLEKLSSIVHSKQEELTSVNILSDILNKTTSDTSIQDIQSKSQNTLKSPVIGDTEMVSHPILTLQQKPKLKSKLKRKKDQKQNQKLIETLHNKEPMKSLNPLYEESPRNGTNISIQHQLAILKCSNQSTCIIPELQLIKKLKIYFCKHTVRSGVRFFYLAREAFLLHPNAILIDIQHIHEADFIIYLPGSSPWHKSECANTSYARKMIVLDEFDGHQLYAPYPSMAKMIEHYPRYRQTGVWYFMYFKRSYISRINGTFLNYPHLAKRDVYPMIYSIAEAYIPNKFNFIREMDLLCTLRGSKSQLTRLRVQQWVSEYATVRNIENYISGEVNTMSRQQVSRQYFEKMYNSRIIVTVNPANWEGDFRLWESFATGALIFVDPVLTPHPFPLQDGVHVIYFSNSNKADLWKKLDYYRANPEIARKIAIAGYLHAMKYHRAVSLADYVLRSAHLKRASRRKAIAVPNYRYTGQYLTEQVESQVAKIKRTQYPGEFTNEGRQ